MEVQTFTPTNRQQIVLAETSTSVCVTLVGLQTCGRSGAATEKQTTQQITDTWRKRHTLQWYHGFDGDNGFDGDKHAASFTEGSSLPLLSRQSSTGVHRKIKMLSTSVIDIVSPGYECSANVTCSIWLKLARQIQNRTHVWAGGL